MTDSASHLLLVLGRTGVAPYPLIGVRIRTRDRQRATSHPFEWGTPTPLLGALASRKACWHGTTRSRTSTSCPSGQAAGLAPVACKRRGARGDPRDRGALARCHLRH